MDKLRERGMFIDGGCSRCNSPTESIMHALGMCPASQDVWQFGPLVLVDKFLSVSFKDLFHQLLSLLTKDQLDLFAMLSWVVWEARNARVWNRRDLNADAIIQKGVYLYEEFRLTMDNMPCSLSSRIQEPIRWKAPPVPWIKLNVDGALFKHPIAAGFCAILRDSSGSVVGARAGRTVGEFNLMEVEAMALWKALQWVRELEHDFLIVESDCEALVRAVTGNLEEWRTEVRGVLLACQNLLQSFSNIQLIHVRREGNVCAHILAKFSETLVEETSWNNDYPQCILACIEEDMVHV